MHKPINENDDYCFYWCILAYFYILFVPNYKDPQRISKLEKMENTLKKDYNINFQGISYPTNSIISNL